MKVVFIMANSMMDAPIDTDEEFRELKTLARNNFDLLPCPAARLEDLTDVLSKEAPDIAHFSTHGAPLGEILLKGEDGAPQPLTRAAFLGLFARFPGNIRLVVLNACNSFSYARALSKKIDCVFGVEQKIDDDVAIDFTREFYRSLVDGQKVQTAYARAQILLDNKNVPKKSRPRPCWRPGVKPFRLFNPTDQATPADSTAAGRFELEARRWGVSADSLRVRKECKPDGSSTIQYTIQGLRSYRRPLRGFHFFLASTVGSAGKPKLDRAGKAVAVWQSDKNSAGRLPGRGSEKTMRRLMDRARKVSGVFRFRAALQPGRSYSFSWGVRVLNSDAVTRWEFNHLYSEKERRHIDKTPIDTPTEYLSRSVWFPIKQLEMSVVYNDRKQREIQISCFVLKRAPEVPFKEVLDARGIVRIYPKPDSQWSVKHLQWESDLARQDALAGKLDTSDPERAIIAVDYPPVGSALSVDWSLPASAPDEEFDRLVEQAERIREALLRHRSERIGRPPGSGARDVLFSDFYREIAADCGPKSGPGNFEVAFMTYRASDARLVMVDGRTNGKAMSRNLWEFWLPFGMGLAGACFRAGDRAFKYLRPREEDLEGEEFYLKIPGYTPHACLLAVPIDHPRFAQPPELDELAPMPERCRQLIGVMTIGSTSLSAEMAALCKKKLSKTEFDALKKLRQRCQQFGNDVCRLLRL